MIGGIAGDVTSDARVNGFTQGPGRARSQRFKQSPRTGTGQEALTKAGDLLRSNPDIKGFFVANDDMALGVARAVANAAQDGQGFHHQRRRHPKGLKAVQSGELAATVAQYNRTPSGDGRSGLQGRCGRKEPAAPSRLPWHW